MARHSAPSASTAVRVSRAARASGRRRDRRPRARQLECGGATDPGAAAGDERDHGLFTAPSGARPSRTARTERTNHGCSAFAAHRASLLADAELLQDPTPSSSRSASASSGTMGCERTASMIRPPERMCYLRGRKQKPTIVGARLSRSKATSVRLRPPRHRAAFVAAADADGRLLPRFAAPQKLTPSTPKNGTVYLFARAVSAYVAVGDLEDELWMQCVRSPSSSTTGRRRTAGRSPSCWRSSAFPTR